MNSKMTAILTKAMTLFVLTVLVTSCVNHEQSPGYEYMPDMYRSPAIEPYVDYGEIRDTIREELNESMSARQPAEGTVPLSENPLNDIPYTIPDNFEGYELAGEILKSPLPQTEEIINQGKQLYANFCTHCHGATGEGDGPVVTVGGHPPPPAYTSPQLKDLPEGKMFHVITYGKGLMGSHKSQLSKVERWKIVAFVKTLQAGAEPDTPGDDEADDPDTPETETENTDTTAQ